MCFLRIENKLKSLNFKDFCEFILKRVAESILDL